MEGNNGNNDSITTLAKMLLKAIASIKGTSDMLYEHIIKNRESIAQLEKEITFLRNHGHGFLSGKVVYLTKGEKHEKQTETLETENLRKQNN